MLLFVGRISPNKAHQRLVEALWVYRRLYDPEARLHLVGPTVTPSYAEAVFAFADELGLADAVAPRRGADGAANWRPGTRTPTCSSACPSTRASASRCSRPCGPGTPIVALDAGAVAETLGEAGILLSEARPATVAAAVGRVRQDDRYWPTWLVDAGHRRLADFAAAVTRRRFVDVLRTVADRAGGGVKLAFVTPRYGIEVIGGAETAARMLAERLCLRAGWEVEVLTSCALDHLTWENTEPAGTTVDQRGHRPPVPDGVAADPRLLRPRRRAAGGPRRRPPSPRPASGWPSTVRCAPAWSTPWPGPTPT